MTPLLSMLGPAPAEDSNYKIQVHLSLIISVLKTIYRRAVIPPILQKKDAFVRRLRRLGGTFYEYQYKIRRHGDRDVELLTWLGWPEDEKHKGGVWVLKMQRSETVKAMTGRIRLAKTMQERCRMIELCGGVFYASPTEEQLVPMEPIPQLTRAEAEEHERRCQNARLSGIDF